MSDALRIAVDMTFPNRNAAGSSVYATELLRELQQRDTVAVIEVASGAAGLPGTLSWLMGGARAAVAGAELVHCPAFVAPWGMGRPFVLTVHDTSILDFPEDHAFEWRTYIRMFLARQARAATRVITGTEHSRREIVRDLGVPADRVAVTPYGVAERFTKVEPRSTIGDPPLLLFPGAPTRRKNLALVLEAMAEAPAESVLGRSRLAITGANAEQFPSHHARIKALGLKNRVNWRGKVAAELMPQLIGSADLVVYPSFHEGFGFPALEGMAAGTPVVASNAACLPEVLGDGALLIDPTDVKAFMEAVEAVLTKTDMRCDLVEKGKARAALYTWQRCADYTVQVYLEGAAAAARGRGGKASDAG